MKKKRNLNIYYFYVNIYFYFNEIFTFYIFLIISLIFLFELLIVEQRSQYLTLSYRDTSIIKINNNTKRYYSTSSKDNNSINVKSLKKTKTLSSPESMPYLDLYAGRGRPKNLPT
jgi:hypothetical protein